MGLLINNWFQFLSGIIVAGCLVSAAHFFKFWSKTRDRLFLHFSIAFLFMAFERVVLTIFMKPISEENFFVYFFRLLAFSLILYAVVDKNRTEKRSL